MTYLKAGGHEAAAINIQMYAASICEITANYLLYREIAALWEWPFFPMTLSCALQWICKQCLHVDIHAQHMSASDAVETSGSLV